MFSVDIDILCKAIALIEGNKTKLWNRRHTTPDPESVICTGVCEIYNKFKWFIDERLQG